MDTEVFLPWGQNERQIFRFHDGVSERAIDPYPVLRKLRATPGLALETDLLLLAAIESGGEFSTEGELAFDRLTSAARKAFNVPPLTLAADGSVIGLTDTECIGLLRGLGELFGRLQAAARPLPNSPPVTEPAASGNSTTPPGSDSGSTGTSSPSSEPTKSPSESS